MRAFILGNSGELLDHDLTLLKGEAVFGVNALPLRAADIITHYVCADIGMAFAPEVRMLVPKSARKFYSRLLWNTIAEEEGVEVFDTYPDRMLGFEPSVEKVYLCTTVVFAALQIAVALGYDEIYLVGIDLGLPANGINHIPEQKILEKIIREKNLRVPTDDKRSAPPSHENIGKRTIHAFVIAKKKLDEMGVQVFNLSRGGALKIFPRKSFEKVFTDSHELSPVVNINHQTGVIPEVEISN